MKLFGYTCTYNEEGMIPYVMPYVERMGYDKFIVYDNMSTDRTVELLSQYPFVEIRPYDTGGKFDDRERTIRHRDAYYECLDMAKIGTDEEEDIWMSWTDFDEVMYFFLERFTNTKQWLIHHGRRWNATDSCMMNLVCPENMDNDSLVHYFNSVEPNYVHRKDGVKCFKWHEDGWKPLLILVNEIYDIPFYQWGNHFLQVKAKDNSIRRIPNTSCQTYHLKYIDKPLLKQHMSTSNYITYHEEGYYETIVKNLDNLYKDLHFMSYPVNDFIKYVNLREEKDTMCGLIMV